MLEFYKKKMQKVGKDTKQEIKIRISPISSGLIWFRYDYREKNVIHNTNVCHH